MESDVEGMVLVSDSGRLVDVGADMTEAGKSTRLL